jgi:hypothetical protein
MATGNSDELVRSFTERHDEADPKAREVLNEFIRVATALPGDPRIHRELAALDESWRDTLSDSQVIKHLRALHPNNVSDKRKRQRPKRDNTSRGG